MEKLPYYNPYERLLALAELEELWDREHDLINKLIIIGHYSAQGTNRKQFGITIRNQVEFLKKIKKVLLKEESHLSPAHHPV